jgi:hypothetical protein
LYRKLQTEGIDTSIDELGSVFKIDERWNSESVERINGMISNLCAMSKGIEVLLALFQKAKDKTVFKYDLHRKKAIFMPHVR